MMAFEQALESISMMIQSVFGDGFTQAIAEWDKEILEMFNMPTSIDEAWDVLATAPEIWPGRKSVPPKKYGMSLHKRRYKAIPAYQYLPSAPRNRPYQRRTY